jgi:hypothetical protein
VSRGTTLFSCAALLPVIRIANTLAQGSSLLLSGSGRPEADGNGSLLGRCSGFAFSVLGNADFNGGQLSDIRRYSVCPRFPRPGKGIERGVSAPAATHLATGT